MPCSYAEQLLLGFLRGSLIFLWPPRYWGRVKKNPRPPKIRKLVETILRHFHVDLEMGRLRRFMLQKEVERETGSMSPASGDREGSGML